MDDAVGSADATDGNRHRFRTHEAIREIGRLVGITLDRTTIGDWVRKGLALPSVRRAKRNGFGHDWSAEDIIGLAWLAEAWRDGHRASAYGAGARELWRRLPSLLRQHGPLYVVATGRDVTIMRHADVVRVVRGAPQRSIALWPIRGSVDQVVRNLTRDREHMPRGGQPG